jgi:hypothetical protein
MAVDWSSFEPNKRLPNKREKKLYVQWRAYLKDSKLSIEEQHRRACSFAEQGRKPD